MSELHGARGSQSVKCKPVELADFSDKRVLMLQGPMGPFFQRLARDLSHVGAKVTKVNFNGGDWLFYRDHHVMFTGRLEEWPIFLERLMDKLGIEVIFLYGDCRPVHKPVFELAKKRDIQVFAFEEGYVRGDYITLEREGVNGRSPIPRSAAYYLNGDVPDVQPPEKVGYSFLHQAWWAFLYHAASALMNRVYPCSTYHRGLGTSELFPQIRSYWRWLKYRPFRKREEKRFSNQLKNRYFLVPLQVAGDSQVVHHSRYGKAGGVPAFIREVIASFALHACKDMHLVLKHHPADRGYTHYGRLIHTCAHEHGIAHRVHYVHDVHLPTLQDNCRGVVTINSTVGLSSITRHKPVKVMGQAIYDIPGLSFPGSLDEFWQASESWRPDAALVRRFLAHVISTTQVNGNFYKRIKASPLNCGLMWPIQGEIVGQRHRRGNLAIDASAMNG